MHALTSRFRETLARWSWLPRGEGVLVAVSGGVDSVVLLHLLLHLPRPRRPRLTVAHFNHRLRGKGSDADAQLVTRICREWKVACRVGTAPPWSSRSNLQARARALRYDFLFQTASDLGLSTVATAHQANDQAETFLLRWVQGSGLRGLTGIPLMRVERGIRVVRPLLFDARDEILDYAKTLKCPWREDPSNRKNRFLRTKIRSLSTRLDRLQPGLFERASRNAVFLRADEEFLEEETKGLLARFQGMSRVPQALSYYPVALYRAQPAALRYRLLQGIYERVSGRTLSGPQVLKLDTLISGPSFPTSLNLGGGNHFFKDSQWFRMGPMGGMSVDLAHSPVLRSVV